MIDRDNRTFICSVVYYDIADYSTKSVEVQLRLKDLLNRFTTEAIKNVAANDRIILDTGDGTAICFLGDPEDALFVAMSLRDAVLSASDQSPDDPILVRFGINLGPVKLVNDINNRKNIIGDGINVGQRVMSFAEPGQILVSRSYFEVVSCLTQEYAKLFQYLGMRADKHIRKHEIYSIARTSKQGETVSLKESSDMDGVRTAARNSIAVLEDNVVPPDSASALKENSKRDVGSSPPATSEHAYWWRSKKFAYGGAAVAIVLVAVLSLVMNRNFGGGENQPDKSALSPAVQLKSSGEALPGKTPSSENVAPEKTESAQPTPPVSITGIQQESPGGSPPGKTPSSENATPEKTESAQPTPPVSITGIQQESPGGSPPESARSMETAGPDQTAQPEPPVSNAIVQFAVTPWGEVYVDGKHQGASPPLTSVQITPGKHRIEIRNTALPPYSKTHEIRPNEKLKISHKF